MQCLHAAVSYERGGVAGHGVADLDPVVRSAGAADTEGPATVAVLARVGDIDDEHALLVDLLHVRLVVIVGIRAVGRLALLDSPGLRLGSHDV